MSNNIVEITGLSKSYPGKGGSDVKAVQNADLNVKEGDFVALKGPSGCGKTTLLLSAGALLTPDDGKVLINGNDPYSLSAPDRSVFRARNVGFVFQSFHLVPYLTVLENVILCELAGNKTVAGTCGKALLEKFGLGHRLGHVPSELSVGEQQRVALARAICGGAKLLLADEPTGNLDTENGKLVLEYLVEFAKSGGAVLMVTHDHRAGDYAFSQVEMLDGKIVSGS